MRRVLVVLVAFLAVLLTPLAASAHVREPGDSRQGSEAQIAVCTYRLALGTPRLASGTFAGGRRLASVPGYFTYTGHYFDRATGLNLAQYRGYDPNLGQVAESRIRSGSREGSTSTGTSRTTPPVRLTRSASTRPVIS